MKNCQALEPTKSDFIWFDAHDFPVARGASNRPPNDQIPSDQGEYS